MSIEQALAKIAENQPKIYNAGKQKQLKDFWDSFQVNGTKTDYHYAFAGTGWKEATFKPQHDIITSAYGAYGMFFNNNIGGSLKQMLNNQNVTLDTSAAEHFTNMFDGSAFTELPTINMINGIATGYAFSACSKLVTIEKIISSERTNWNSTSFYNCIALTNVVFEGIIAKSITLENSTLLTVDSVVSLFNALKDLTDTSLSYAVTLNAVFNSKLSAEQKAIATNKGWTITFKQV